MIDMGKVIKGLECIAQQAQNGVCGECAYFRPFTDDPDCGWCDKVAIANDALALLRGQKPVLVKHKKVNDEYQAIEDEFVCKHCGAWWMIPEQDLKYCPGCGRKVKWDG